MTDSKALQLKYPDIIQAPVVVKMPVLWGDMDSAKHVNNLIYLRWTETARILLFNQLMDTSFDGKEGPILGWQDCKYIFPMTFPDTAIVTSAVSQILEDRFIMVSNIYSQQHNRIVAISEQTIVPYDYVSLKKIDIPSAWRAKLGQLMSKNG
jgi:acyl-CoA thioester hydrolase